MPRPTLKLKQEEFVIEYINNGGIVSRAAEKVGISYSNARRWFDEDEGFKLMLADAKEQWHERLRSIAMKRATEKSDTLLIFLLKSLKPELYHDELRTAKYMADRNLLAGNENLVPIRAVLVREPAPGEKKPELEHSVN